MFGGQRKEYEGAYRDECLVGPASARDIGRLKEMAGVVSQGQTLGELEESIRDAYQLMTDAEPAPTAGPILTREIEV